MNETLIEVIEHNLKKYADRYRATVDVKEKSIIDRTVSEYITGLDDVFYTRLFAYYIIEKNGGNKHGK